MDKERFLLDEIWMNIFGAAFQRANVYIDNADSQQKIFLKNKVRGLIEMTMLSDYNSNVSDKTHLENIHKIKSFSENFSTILNNDSFSFGVSQKILNLCLKYYWCLDRIKCAPPHFPVDRLIQSALKIKNPVAWTTNLDEKKYMEIINVARTLLPKFNKANIAELELFLFERRSNT